MSEITSGTVVRPLGNLMASHRRLPLNAIVKNNLVAQVQQVDTGATRSRRQENCLMQCSTSSTCHLSTYCVLLTVVKEPYRLSC